MNYNFIAQIETVGPEGYKLIWPLFLLLIIIASAIYLKPFRKILPHLFPGKIKVSVSKNKSHYPNTITLKIENKTQKPIEVDNPIIRFKKIRTAKAFKINAINKSIKYPQIVDAGKSHILPIALEPFYNFNKKLKKFSRLRIEVMINKTINKKSGYILLKSTLFRKIK